MIIPYQALKNAAVLANTDMFHSAVPLKGGKSSRNSSQ